LGATQTFTIPAGEHHKTRESWSSLTDQLLAAGFTRDTTILALGGGVVGDLAGFVAATFMRGIPFIQLPTTLLAMIDASIGGKTGVDTPAGKNLVGAFHPPAAVVIDPQVLATLALSELRAGLAEAVKHGAIADETYFISLSDAATQLLAPSPTDRDERYVTQLIEHSVRIKADVVARDTHEHGVRKILNFGHTVGHAIELLSDFALSHGDAVAIGMVLESAASEESGITVPGTTDQLVTTLTHLGLPTERPAGPTPDQILNVMRGDKKSRAGAIEYAVPTRIGTMAGATSGYAIRIDDTVMRRVLTRA
jgi:3-dehydroquinate synthase